MRVRLMLIVVAGLQLLATRGAWLRADYPQAGASLLVAGVSIVLAWRMAGVAR